MRRRVGESRPETQGVEGWRIVAEVKRLPPDWRRVGYQLHQGDSSQTPRTERRRCYPSTVILFDVGGVLLTNGWDHGERRPRAMEHFTWTGGLPRPGTLAPYDAWERGAIPMKAYLDATLLFTRPGIFLTTSSLLTCLPSRSCLPDGAAGNPGRACRIR